MHHSHTQRLRRDTWVEPHPAGGAGSHLLRAWLEEGVAAWFPGSGALTSLVSLVRLRASFQTVNWMGISKSPVGVLVPGRAE